MILGVKIKTYNTIKYIISFHMILNYILNIKYFVNILKIKKGYKYISFKSINKIF